MTFKHPEGFEGDEWRAARSTAENHAKHSRGRKSRRQYEPTKYALRIAKRIKEHTNVTIYPFIYRTYAGKNQRSEGSWSWWAYTRNGISVGSQWSIGELLKTEEIFSDVEYGSVVLTPSQ